MFLLYHIVLCGARYYVYKSKLFYQKPVVDIVQKRRESAGNAACRREVMPACIFDNFFLYYNRRNNEDAGNITGSEV